MSTTVIQGIAAQIVGKAALDALELGVPLHASNVGCSFDAWVCSSTFKSATLNAQMQKQAEQVLLHLHALGFKW
jgi:hypothetical protein